MLRKALLGLALTAGVAFAGDQKGQAPAKAQAPAAPKAQDASKGQAPAATPVPAKIVTQTVITREYAPFEKHRRLFFRQVGPSRVQTCTNCVTCPNCQK